MLIWGEGVKIIFKFECIDREKDNISLTLDPLNLSMKKDFSNFLLKKKIHTVESEGVNASK